MNKIKIGWVLYICFGMDFVTSEHSSDYSRYLNLGIDRKSVV